MWLADVRRVPMMVFKRIVNKYFPLVKVPATE